MFEHFNVIILMLDLGNRARFPLRFDSMKMKILQKDNTSANAMVHITFIYKTMLVDVMIIVFVYQQCLLFKKNSNGIALYWRLHFG